MDPKMFADRKDAAIKLAHALNNYRDQNAVVLGIPRGGVEIAYYVAMYLQAEFSMIITRKLGYPDNPEAAFGAIAEDGSIYLSEETSGTVLEEEISAIIEAERMEIQRRINTLRNGKPLPGLEGKIVIIVDDGIATGATILTAIAMCRKRHPSKIIIGAPVASAQMEHALRKLVDEVVILEKPSPFYAVGQGYRNFTNLTDAQTIAFVNAWKNRLETAS